MASSKQGDGCGTLIFLAVVWWLGSKYWAYVSVGLVALLMAGVVWFEAFLVWLITAAIFKEPTPCSGAGKWWHAVFLIAGMVAGGYMFYQDRENFFWKSFLQILFYTPAIGYLPTWLSNGETVPVSTPPPQRITRPRPASSSNANRSNRRVHSSSYNTTDLPNETNRAGNIRDVDFDLDV